MAMMDRHGKETSAVMPLDVSDEIISRFRVAMMLRLRRRGVSTRVIAKIFRMDHSNVVKRCQSVPERARDRYERLELAELGGTGLES